MCLIPHHADFGYAVLQCLACILPFLDKDMIENIPYLTASCMSVMPEELQQTILDTLVFHVLPFTITRQSVFDDAECHSCQSVSAVIMLVFEYSLRLEHHCQLMQCLMTLKANVIKDILCVIAYGTVRARSSAARALFLYWPAFNDKLFDKRDLLSKLRKSVVVWTRLLVNLLIFLSFDVQVWFHSRASATAACRRCRMWRAPSCASTTRSVLRTLRSGRRRSTCASSAPTTSIASTRI